MRRQCWIRFRRDRFRHLSQSAVRAGHTLEVTWERGEECVAPSLCSSRASLTSRYRSLSLSSPTPRTPRPHSRILARQHLALRLHETSNVLSLHLFRWSALVLSLGDVHCYCHPHRDRDRRGEPREPMDRGAWRRADALSLHVSLLRGMLESAHY